MTFISSSIIKVQKRYKRLQSLDTMGLNRCGKTCLGIFGFYWNSLQYDSEYVTKSTGSRYMILNTKHFEMQ